MMQKKPRRSRQIAIHIVNPEEIGRKESDREPKLFSAWASLAFSLGALIVSILSLYLSYQNQSVEMRPILSHYEMVTTDEMSIGFQNKGNGVAHIQSISVWHRGEKIFPNIEEKILSYALVDLLREYRLHRWHKDGNILEIDENRPLMQYYPVSTGEHISPLDIHKIFIVDQHDRWGRHSMIEQSGYRARFSALKNETAFEICYCDIEGGQCRSLVVGGSANIGEHSCEIAN